MKQKRLSKLLSAVLSAALVLSLAPAALAAEGETHITIIGTSDTHGNVWGYSYEDMAESTDDGLARISTYVNQVRAENPNTILVDTGDTIQGTIMTDDLYSKDTANHPVPAAMNYMGYDAWTLGNHEFNFGVDTLKSILAQAKMPVLAANIKNADGSYFTGAGYTIVERGGVKVAVIGVDTPNIPRWDGTKQGVEELTFEPLADAVNECIDAIGGSADVIMVCAHAGLEAEYSTDGSDAGKTILEQCPEVDILQLGHTHTTYVNNDTIPVGETTNNAGEVVRYDLTLDANKEITSATVETVSMEGIEPDQGLRDVAAVKDAQDKTVSFIQDNVLGHAAADFQPANEIAGIPAGRIQDTAVIDLIGTVQLENSGADVSAAALFKDTSDLPEGDINYGNIFDIYKFDNTLYRVKVTGAELKAYMEWSAECYNQWKEGDINISFDPEYPDYLYDMFAGVEYEIDLSQPKGQRIKNVMFKGEPLQDDQTLTLAVNNYRYSSALKGQNLISGTKEWESSNSIRDMIVAYFAEHSPVAPEVDNNWKIVGVDLNEDDARRAELIGYINDGLLPAPYAESYNLADYDTLVAQAKANAAVLVDGTPKVVSTATDAAGNTYYRLRDLAAALNGTGKQFNVLWNAGVEITTGAAYADPALTMPAQAPAGLAAETLAVKVDGAAQSMSAVLSNGNYYVASSALEALGITCTVTDGTLNITTK